MTEDPLREQVRDRYAAAARAATGDASCGCGTTCCTDGATSDGCCGDACCRLDADADFGQTLYSAEECGELPGPAVLASLGCGNPTAVAELCEGETVLDLGSGVTNVTFLKGLIEQVPLPDASVDVVISNCVINLSTEKSKVLAEIARVLKPSGRVGVSDVVAENQLSSAQRAERGSYVGCIAGALSKREYEVGLTDAGLVDVSVTYTDEVADGMHSAIIKATKRA